MNTLPPKKKFIPMPSLTIDGKREIIQMALAKVGEKTLTEWLSKRNITSIRTLNEQVRKHKAKFFRELFALSQLKEP